MTNQSTKESGGGTCRRAFVGVTRRGKFWGKGCRQARKPVPPIVRSARSKQGLLFSRPPNHPSCTDRVRRQARPDFPSASFADRSPTTRLGKQAAGGADGEGDAPFGN